MHLRYAVYRCADVAICTDLTEQKPVMALPSPLGKVPPAGGGRGQGSIENQRTACYAASAVISSAAGEAFVVLLDALMLQIATTVVRDGFAMTPN